MYLPIMEGCSITPILSCLPDIKDWMAQSFLRLMTKNRSDGVWSKEGSVNPPQWSCVPWLHI